MLELDQTRFWQQDADHVEAHVGAAAGMFAQPHQCQLTQFVDLAPGDRLSGGAVRGRGPCLDLCHDKDIAVARHDVNLASSTPPVAGKDREPRADEVPRREVLALLSQFVLGEHATTSAAHSGALDSSAGRQPHECGWLRDLRNLWISLRGWTWRKGQ